MRQYRDECADGVGYRTHLIELDVSTGRRAIPKGGNIDEVLLAK
jgi:hypothetical protein